jgi:aldehyde:ferredoxin oxidoreductase
MSLEQILYVDLDTCRIRSERLSPEDRRSIGGASLGVTLLERFLVAAPASCIRAGSPMILSIGPLTGTQGPSKCQVVLTHISPLTGGVNDSVVTHPIALALAEARTAALVLSGRSEAPAWLCLRDGGVQFEDATHLWGQEVGRAARALEQIAGSPGLVVGPAAEHGVPYASLGSERHSAGRGGAGAALAAMNVKGLAAHMPRSGKNVSAARKSDRLAAPRSQKALRRLRLLNERNALPTRNFRARSFPEAEKLADDLASQPGLPGLPYEAIFAFGPMLGVARGSVVRHAVAACDRLGLDVISAGGTLAWALEAIEAGVLQDFMELSSDGTERFLDSVAHRDGPAELLALGSRAAAKRLDSPAGEWAMHVRGLEIPGYDPRALPSLALGYAVGSRGACHVRSGAYEIDLMTPMFDPPEPAQVAGRAAGSEDRSTLLDSLILSRTFRNALGEPFEAAARLLADAGQRDLADVERLRETMRGVASTRRRINPSRGWTADGDCLPRRLLEEDGGAATLLTARRVKDWVSAYYRLRGWSSAGDPP